MLQTTFGNQVVLVYGNRGFEGTIMPKRTYQPKRVSRKRKLGYRARLSTRGGRRVLKARRLKGRWKLTPA